MGGSRQGKAQGVLETGQAPLTILGRFWGPGLQLVPAA